MTFESEEFHPQAAKRLFLAVVNQAISDVKQQSACFWRWSIRPFLMSWKIRRKRKQLNNGC